MNRFHCRRDSTRSQAMRSALGRFVGRQCRSRAAASGAVAAVAVACHTHANAATDRTTLYDFHMKDIDGNVSCVGCATAWMSWCAEVCRMHWWGGRRSGAGVFFWLTLRTCAPAQPVDMARYKGKVVLVVNVASA